ncbi:MULTISPECIES: hypothetical protein [Paraburkholderia]|uniref:Uncharacterized protein n=2 Tax=Paraburkholderia TaxID=1822464 RepID=A0A7Y9WPQ3_9BURK|nr:hypothetical protein [Paraburkholderia bryophila]NYH23941.1 hypothetical protein [Paraburkholderia bryophila]
MFLIMSQYYDCVPIGPNIGGVTLASPTRWLKLPVGAGKVLWGRKNMPNQAYFSGKLLVAFRAAPHRRRDQFKQNQLNA